MVTQALSLLVMTVVADLTILRDYGGDDLGLSPQISIPDRANITVPGSFPVQTPVLSPGRVEPHALLLSHEGLRVHPTVFVIGADALSVEWVSVNRIYLQSINAHGVVVNVESRADFHHLKQLAAPLPLVAVPGHDFARVVKTAHYPFLIHEGRVAQ